MSRFYSEAAKPRIVINHSPQKRQTATEACSTSFNEIHLKFETLYANTSGRLECSIKPSLMIFCANRVKFERSATQALPLHCENYYPSYEELFRSFILCPWPLDPLTAPHLSFTDTAEDSSANESCSDIRLQHPAGGELCEALESSLKCQSRRVNIEGCNRQAIFQMHKEMLQIGAAFALRGEAKKCNGLNEDFGVEITSYVTQKPLCNVENCPLDFDVFSGLSTTENPLHSVNESIGDDDRTFRITNKTGFPENKTNFRNVTNSALVVSSTTKPSCFDLEKLYNCVASIQTYLTRSRDNSNFPFPISLESLHAMCDSNAGFQRCLDDVGVSPPLRIACSEEPVLKESFATVGKMCTQRQGRHIRILLDFSWAF